MSVGDQAEDLERLEPGAALEEGQLDDEGAGDDLGAGPLDQVAAGTHGAAGGQDVVDQEDTAAGAERVGVDLEAVVAVFELVVERDRGIRKLARLADRHEP